MVAIRNQMLGLLGAVPTIFGDINGDGTVDINDYTAVREAASARNCERDAVHDAIIARIHT